VGIGGWKCGVNIRFSLLRVADQGSDWFEWLSSGDKQGKLCWSGGPSGQWTVDSSWAPKQLVLTAAGQHIDACPAAPHIQISDASIYRFDIDISYRIESSTEISKFSGHVKNSMRNVHIYANLDYTICTN